MQHVVLAGAGHAHVIVLKRFGQTPVPGMRLTLVTRAAATLYSGMLPGVIAGHYTQAEAHIDIAALARFAGAQLIQGEVVGLDLERGAILCRSGQPLPYDLVSLDIGSQPNAPLAPGAFSLPVKPIDSFLPRFDAMLAQTQAAGSKAHIAVVGAGAAGVELMLAVARRLRAEMSFAGHDPSGLVFTLITATDDILPGFPPAFRKALRRALADAAIGLRVGTSATHAADGVLSLAGGASHPADHVLWTTEAAAAPWLRSTGLKLDAQGFVSVDACLNAVGHGNIFAAGDTAAFGPRPLPKSGVYAVRAGPALARNIRAMITGAPLSPFRPQRNALCLVSTADGRAVGTRNNLTVSGRWVWRYKDWIDRHFMAQFQNLPTR